jgi:hypothetical protein
MAYRGRFRPTNEKKYKGDVNNIVWRSTWELKVMNFFDLQPNILEWASEEIVIPYISPIDEKIHRYYPDFYVKKLTTDGKTVRQLIEVKPYKQTMAPKPQRKITAKYLAEIKTWSVNEAKWEAAKRWCDDYGWEFVTLSEKELGIPLSS